jgi:hypothetical protein
MTQQHEVPAAPDGPTGITVRWLEALLVDEDDELALELMHTDYQARLLAEARGNLPGASAADVLDALRGIFADVDPRAWGSMPAAIDGDQAVVTLVDLPPGPILDDVQALAVRFDVQHTRAGWRVLGRA